ncbi:peroxide stress protein YaaA [Neolewinella antarctica]|uniref:UPF0246 protein GGR27_001701 n=1 Tax=Neolewinella antarctica TaxID=442734 RepID=A0ABX0XAF1_9BACT|nr:peroxide stress protein YaaA [Neolewinella antarctica]NJC26202.1 hypothetical protein [Neolewinella antarctica]
MLLLLSPAKTLDMQPTARTSTQPRLLAESAELVGQLRGHSKDNLRDLMKISEKLADLNHGRFQAYSEPFTSENASAAGHAFRGDVYQDLAYHEFTESQKTLADRQIRILSGLYGVLRPSDLMQAYRLEMGTRLKNLRGKNLYEFWGDKITDLLNEDLTETGDDTVLNLASQEYFKSVNTDKLAGRLLTAHFKEDRKGKLKVIAFNAKKARGRLAQLITLEGMTSPAGMQELVVNDYIYSEELSSADDWVWTK